MNIAVVGTNGLPAKYGGYETLVNYLTLLNSELEIDVYCSKTKKKEQIKTFNGSKLIYGPFKANGFQSVFCDIHALINCWFRYDCILILGTSGTLILPFLRLFRNTKTVINLGGFEWKRSKLNYLSKKFVKFCDYLAIINCTNIIVDNIVMKRYIERNFNKKPYLIEYGGDHVSNLKPTVELCYKYKFLNKKFHLSISRSQEDNNLHVVLEAYSKMPNKILVLISNYNSFEYGLKLKKEYSKFKNIFMIDAIYDLKILDVIRSECELYIHSHKLCGTAPSLVEIMSLGKPVFSFDSLTNRSTTENKTHYFSNTNDLITLNSLIKFENLMVIGEKMLDISKRKYRWEIIKNKYFKLLNPNL